MIFWGSCPEGFLGDPREKKNRITKTARDRADLFFPKKEHCFSPLGVQIGVQIAMQFEVQF